MDVFKLLTRSTKLKSSSSHASQSRPSNLPSAGEAATPQLFPDAENRQAFEQRDIGTTRGKKRKRALGGKERTTEADVAALDFDSALSTSEPAVRSKTTEHVQGELLAEEIPIGDSNLCESERKAVLKSHQIKVTDLRTAPLDNIVNDEQPKKKKKKKSEKEPVVLSRKQRKAAQRIYPEPLTSFAFLRSRYNISRRLAENILNQGYRVPTEVQLGSLPLLLGDLPNTADRATKDAVRPLNYENEPDLLVVAPTGSGKTLAFMIPLINKIIRHHHHEESQEKGVLSIIVAPTKELAHQIVNEGRKLTVGTGVKVTAMRKGMRIVEDQDDNKEEQDADSQEEEESDSASDEEAHKKRKSRDPTVTKSDILVATPLMLVNSLSNNGKHEVSPLPSVKSLVLDEADVLLDPLFRDQTNSIWRSCINSELRVGLWSATMGSNIEELAKSTIKDRQTRLDLKEESSLIRLVVGLKDSAIPNISHKLVYAATEQGKLLGLRQLLHPTSSSSSLHNHLRPPFLVFTQTIPRAIALHSELMYDIPLEAGGSSRIAVLHSELSDSQRSDVMTGFRKGEIWILITTDLLSRGVDFRGINGVVNYDIPNSSAAYVHRVGRTGRAGRQGGAAVTFYTKEDIPYVKNIANVIAASEKAQGKTSEEGVQKWLLDALPNLSKRDKKDLKQHGVQARRRAVVGMEKDGKDRRRTRISTKSGFERRMENNKKGAIKGSKRRVAQEATSKHAGEDDNAWGGFED